MITLDYHRRLQDWFSFYIRESLRFSDQITHISLSPNPPTLTREEAVGMSSGLQYLQSQMDWNLMVARCIRRKLSRSMKYQRQILGELLVKDGASDAVQLSSGAEATTETPPEDSV